MFRSRALLRFATLAISYRYATITPVPMPALSPTMEKGKVTEWCKKIGDPIGSGDTFCKVETDKAVVSYDNAAEEGFLARILVKEGEEAVVGKSICLMVEEKGDVDSDEVREWKEEGEAGQTSPSTTEAASSTQQPTQPLQESVLASVAGTGSGERVKASPYARKLAAEKNISLQNIKGTGGGVGRITSKDVETAISSGVAISSSATAASKAAGQPSTQQSVSTSTATQAASTAAAAKAKPAAATTKPAAATSGKPVPAANPNYTDIPLTTMRAVIAKRLHQSKNLDIPHYYLFEDCRVDNVIALLKQLNAKGNGQYKITLNDYFIKALARANLLTPEVNAAWHGEFIRQYATVDVSVAVATPAGLITPIIRNAHVKGLVQISKEMKALAKKARDNALMPDEFQGGTCSISNLGGMGTTRFTAIINPPQSLILAVGTGVKRPQIVHNDETGEDEMSGKVETVVSFTASFDHRVVDGAVGSRWFKGFRDSIENPLSLLL